MTAYNTVQYANTLLGETSYSVMNPGRDTKGKSRYLYAETETAGTINWAQNDTISIGVVPATARVVSVIVQNAALGASVTLGVTGDDGSARTFVTAYDASAAHNVRHASEYLTPLAIDTIIVATLAAANPTDDVRLQFLIEYVID